MRKRLLSIMLFLMGGVAMSLHAQPEVKIISDVTSKVQNADFSADEPIAQLIRTYDYDMTDDGLGAGGTEMFGQQAVTGWVAANPSDNIKVLQSNSGTREDGANARAAGIFALLSDYDDLEAVGRLGGAYYAPSKELSEAEGINGPVLGMVGVWGADVKYTQPITLPAGDYMLVVTLQNTAGGSAFLNSNNGFVPETGVATYSTKLSFNVGEWATDTIFFRLTAETAGALSLGYKSGNYGSGGAAHIFIDNVKLYTIDTNVLDQKEIDEAKALLLAQIEIGEDRDADTSAAQDVYDNPNATLAEVLAAIEAQKELNEQAITDLSAFFIKNPHFSLDDPIEDGITTYDYDMKDPNGANGGAVTHYGMQPVTGWEANAPSTNTVENVNNGRASGVLAIGSDAFLGGKAFLPPTAMSDGATEGKLLGFISVWTAKSQYTQRVSLPAGKYTLTFSYYNVGGGGAVSKNLMGFVAEDGTEHLGSTTTFTANKWLKESITFELDEPTAGYFTMGYTAANAGSDKMPHLFVDGVSLNYVGTGINASRFALSAAIATGNETLDKDFNADLREQLQEAVDEAQELFDNDSSDDDANIAAADVINNLIAEINANIAAYERLQHFYESDLRNAVEKYDAKNYAEINEWVNEQNDAVADALSEFLWTTDEIDAFIAAFVPALKEKVQALFDAAVASGEPLAADLDISILFDQLAYTYSASAVSNTNVPDKEWNYGNASNFKTQYGTAEVWNQSPFEVSRTLADMPAGKYTITTKAFYRTADNETNLSDFNEDDAYAFVFAGNVKTALTNVAEVANNDGEEFEGWTAAGGTYVPNSQLAAYNLFNDEGYAEQLEKSVSTALLENGNLTFGIKADEMSSNSWVVWYTFSVAYNALTNEVVNDELQGLIDQAVALTEDTDNMLVNQADDNLNTAIDLGEKALGSDDLAVKKSAMDALLAAIAYYNEGNDLIAKLSDQIVFFDELYQNYPDLQGSSSKEDDFCAILTTETPYENNEQIQGFIDALPQAWVAYVLGQDLSAASETNPVDVTPVILNPAFDNGNINNWTIKAGELEDGTADRIGQNQGYQSNNEYPNTEGDIILSQFLEAWRPNGEALHDGSVEQTLLAPLPAAYYLLEVDGYATNQNMELFPEEGITGVSLVAINGNTQNAVEIGLNRVEVEGEEGVTYAAEDYPKHFSVAFYADGTTETTVGIKVSNTTASWFAVDNFALAYLGTIAPDAVQGVEATAQQGVTAIYNLAGQRVGKAVKGIYIINGKKVIK